ncbi:MAG: SufD family Fe-S cluster assembly protein [Thiovulaceae bacterium]|nr:SufD family Fe-S cluster assembly protein [Sulfurimonadaceae bacterium]
MQPITLEIANEEHPLYERVKALGIPANKTEHYRHFAIKPLLSKEYDITIPTVGTPIQGTKLIIENGVVKEYPNGVTLSFIDDFQADSTHYDALYFMSHVLCQNVINIQTKNDITFEIEHHFSDKNRFIPYRIAIQIEANTQVEVFESFHTKGSQESLLLYGVDVYIASESRLNWIRNQNRYLDEAAIVGSHHYHAAEQSSLDLHTFDLGSGNALHIYKIDLDSYASTNASHLLLATQEAHSGNVVYINHNQPHSKSIQESRTILKDGATGIFDGKILINHDAKYSKAKQNSKAILLSKNAHMYTKPQLEIYTDELEASHGSSIGELDEEVLFYICSRGIELEEAKKMLVLAFASILIDTLDNAKYEEIIRMDFELAIKD